MNEICITILTGECSFEEYFKLFIFEILTVQIPCGGMTFDITRHINYQIQHTHMFFKQTATYW